MERDRCSEGDQKKGNNPTRFSPHLRKDTHKKISGFLVVGPLKSEINVPLYVYKNTPFYYALHYNITNRRILSRLRNQPI